MKKKSYVTCLNWGMLFGIVLGAAMGKLAVEIAIGYCVALYIIYLLHLQKEMTINRIRIQERNGLLIFKIQKI